MGKKLSSMFLIIILITTGSINVNAVNKNASVEAKSATEYLLSKGYPQKVISTLPEEEINRLTNALKADPVNTSLTWDVLMVDNLEEIQKIVNLDNSELIQCGLSMDEVKKCRNKVEEIRNCTDDELKKLYDISKEEVKVLRKSLEKNNEYKRKIINKNATISGASITSSEMIYTQSKYSSSSAQPNYEISISYEWIKPYYLDMFDDVVAVSWGGNLNFVPIVTHNEYYHISGLALNYIWGYLYEMTSWSTVQTPNVGVIYSSPQSKMSQILTTRMRYGYMRFRIYQTRFQGYDTTVVSQYGHKTITLGGGTISLKGPAVSLGYKYATHTQASSILRY